MIDFGNDAHFAPERRSVLMWSYAEPWCACGVLAGSAVVIKGVRCLVERSFVGPSESPRAVAAEVSRRWGETASTGSLEGGWTVVLLVTPSEGPAVGHPCGGDWRMHVGWR